MASQVRARASVSIVCSEDQDVSRKTVARMSDQLPTRCLDFHQARNSPRSLVYANHLDQFDRSVIFWYYGSRSLDGNAWAAR